VLAKLGLADLIKDEPKTADDLAEATGTHGPSLFRVLRALASVGVITQDDRNRFGATPLSETLRDVPGSIRAFAMTELGEEHYPAWGELLHSVRTGGIAFDKAFGEPVWEFFAKNPDNAKRSSSWAAPTSRATSTPDHLRSNTRTSTSPRAKVLRTLGRHRPRASD